MQIRHGITGNYYITSLSKEEVEVVCDAIGKSKKSIKWHAKFGTFVARVKDKKTKEKLKQIKWLNTEFGK